MESTVRYIFDRERLVAPRDLQLTCPPLLSDQLHRVRQAATSAFQALRGIEYMYSGRFRALCPRTKQQAHTYSRHAESIDRLLAWTADVKPRSRATLAPAPKLSPSSLRFEVHETAYEAFAADYARILEQYLGGPYLVWIQTKEETHEVIRSAGLDEMEAREWRRWWHGGFLKEMELWERRVEGLALPAWREIVAELYALILERVDVYSVEELCVGCLD